MPRPSKTEQEKGYIRSWWDEVKEIETDFHGTVMISTYASKRPGVFAWRLSFTPMIGDVENALHRAAVGFNFPDARNVSLAGALFVAAMKLGDLVADLADEQKKRVLNGG